MARHSYAKVQKPSDAMPSRIGTLAEKSLHAALKDWYARPGDLLECRVEGYFIDILRPSPDPETPPRCIEIQTRHLGAMKPKLSALLDRYPIQVVHPISYERHIIRIDADGEIRSRRKSPKRGTMYHLFPELVSLPVLLSHPNLTLEVALIRDEEVWVDDGKGSWRRKRWSIHDRRLLEVKETRLLTAISDYAALLPTTLPDQFDSQELAKAIGQPRPLAQKMAYCLREMGILQIASKRGRSHLYSRT
ncbi:MAG: hypothetical protein IPK19_09070 [Chloroflexi bacterium]|nr:hypothetical protein [Chloroflexota bacterium]